MAVSPRVVSSGKRPRPAPGTDYRDDESLRRFYEIRKARIQCVTGRGGVRDSHQSPRGEKEVQSVW